MEKLDVEPVDTFIRGIALINRNPAYVGRTLNDHLPRDFTFSLMTDRVPEA